MNRKTRTRLFYVSPWLLAMATGLLVLIIVVFSVTNIQREKRLMTRALIQKAATLMRIVNSGSRSSFVADFRRGMHLINPWNDHVQRVISHVAEAADIRYLAVVDEDGEVVAHSDPGLIGTTLHIAFSELQSFVEVHELRRVHYHIVSTGEKERIFEAVRPFVPLRPLPPDAPFRKWLRLNGMGGFGTYRGPGGFNPHHHFRLFDPDQQYVIVAGLSLSSYDAAIKKLYLQAAVLSVVMLLVGCGGWLSLAAVQGYRVSQHTLGEMRAFTGLLISRLPVGIIATDRDGLIKTCNRAAAAMIRVEADKLPGAPPEKVLPEDFTVFFQQEMDDNGTGRTGGEGRDIHFSADGITRILHCQVIRISESREGDGGRVLLLTDLTDLKNLEREMRRHERLAAIGEMAAGVAHEVRNPLSSIKGLALLLQGKFASGSKERQSAQLLIQEVERLNRAITELLNFTGSAAMDLQPVDIGALLKKEVQLLGTDIDKGGVTLKLEIADDLAPVRADADRLNQVFLNLLLNALQAMPGGGTLAVSAGNSPDGREVIIAIKDSGRGIPAAMLGQVFYPYFTTRPGGTGLGLAMSQKIVTDHDGTIRLESEEGAGTTVTVVLPVMMADSV